MKTIKVVFSGLVFQIVSFNTVSAAMQQPADKLTNSSQAVYASNVAVKTNTSITTVKEIVTKKILDTPVNLIDNSYKITLERLKTQAESIRSYAKKHNYSIEYCFLVDMSLPSGKNRFFVYNLKDDIIENASLVAHGFGSTRKDGTDQLDFSNNNYSFKTSLGKYKIGGSYKGTYGLAYKLYGLDSTNSKAYERAIVLHADTHMPETETYPARIFQSAGCPAVSPGFLPVLGKCISNSKQPILMWIYN